MSDNLSEAQRRDLILALAGDRPVVLNAIVIGGLILKGENAYARNVQVTMTEGVEHGIEAPDPGARIEYCAVAGARKRSHFWAKARLFIKVFFTGHL